MLFVLMLRRAPFPGSIYQFWGGMCSNYGSTVGCLGWWRHDEFFGIDVAGGNFTHQLALFLISDARSDGQFILLHAGRY
jgi:hypothetical protein